ncbi:MAG: hypothetical protein J5870_00995 [Clostridia bacterium]|nr:hypothetical protein [Clostridia bacterium]
MKKVTIKAMSFFLAVIMAAGLVTAGFAAADGIRGELATGDNKISAFGRYSFEAPETGYYLFTDVNSMLFACEASESKAAESGYRIREHVDQECLSSGDICGDPAYFEKGKTYYLDFEAFEKGDSPKMTLNIKYLGEITSATLENSTVWMGQIPVEMCTYDDKGMLIPLYGHPVVITFSNGETYESFDPPFGHVDSVAPGKHTFLYALCGRNETGIEINMRSFSELVDKVVLPENFVPSSAIEFTESGDIAVSGKENPEYIEIHFKDGTVKRIDESSKTREYILPLDGSNHSLNYYYTYDFDGRILFVVLADDEYIAQYEPDYTVTSFFGGFTNYLKSIGNVIANYFRNIKMYTEEDLFKEVVIDNIVNITRNYADFCKLAMDNSYPAALLPTGMNAE